MLHRNGRQKITSLHVRKRSHIDVNKKAARCPIEERWECNNVGGLDISTRGALNRQDTLSRICRQPIEGLRTSHVDKLQKNTANIWCKQVKERF